MYEHPYLSRQITLFEQEQMEKAAARRVFLAEHADQIVPRPAGGFRRMLRRMRGPVPGDAPGAARPRRSAPCPVARCEQAAVVAHEAS